MREVVVNAADVAGLEALLAYSAESKGRALTANLRINGVDLKAGDRLEASPDIFDRGLNLTTLASFPATLYFFRPIPNSFVNFWCPLLQDGVLNYENSLDDAMHSGDEGIASYLAGSVFGLVIRSGLFGIPTNNQEKACKVGAQKLEDKLMDLYSEDQFAREHGPHRLTTGILLGAMRLRRPKVNAKAWVAKLVICYTPLSLTSCGCVYWYLYSWWSWYQ